MYFLMDDAQLGGGGSAGVDLVVGGTKYEIKASLYSANEKIVTGFKLGGTAPLSGILSELLRYKKELKLETKGKGQNEINGAQMAAIQKAYPNEYAKLDATYARIAAKYFGNTPVIFINNNSSNKVDPEDTAEKTRQLSRNAGNILAIKKVTARDVTMQVASQGTIKPKVKI